MENLRLHRLIICVDIERSSELSDSWKAVARQGMYEALRSAFNACEIALDDHDHEDRGDGALIVLSADVPKDRLLSRLPLELVVTLARHNVSEPRARVRLRIAVHAGEVLKDAHGFVGTAVDKAFRLSEAPPLKDALAASPALVAIITSSDIYQDVIWHTPAARPESYLPIRVSVKETDTTAWICLPDAPDFLSRTLDHQRDRPQWQEAEAAPSCMADAPRVGSGHAALSTGNPRSGGDDSAGSADHPHIGPSTTSDSGPRADDVSGFGSAGRGQRPPRLTFGGRSRIVVGAVCLALLAGGGWLTWDQLSKPDTVNAQTHKWDPNKSATLRKIAQRNGTIVIGIKRAQPGLSKRVEGDPSKFDGDPSKWDGFDVEIAKRIAGRPELKHSHLVFKDVSSANREDGIDRGDLDLIVGSYSITPERKEKVDFAGPYFVTSQGILMYGGRDGMYIKNRYGSRIPERVNGWAELKNVAKEPEYKEEFLVCTSAGSTSEKELGKVKIKTKSVTDYQQCADDLKRPESDYSAMVTDRAVLVGFQGDGLKMIKDPIPGTTQYWGIGLKKGDGFMKHLVCEALRDLAKNGGGWSKLRGKYLSELGSESATPPEMTECDDV
ncbi:transporter substrate-binding domain-containing protein [Spirillospora sp. NPDC047418]